MYFCAPQTPLEPRTRRAPEIARSAAPGAQQQVEKVYGAAMSDLEHDAFAHGGEPGFNETKGGTMQIKVRNEPATQADEPAGSEATPARTCIWSIGPDGETMKTAYVAPGEEVTLDINEQLVPQFGEPVPIGVAPPPAA